jgi:uncharacterized protein YukE
VLDGFYTAWNNARETFGHGSPQPGADFDRSPQLSSLGSDVSKAAPGEKWSGTAAANYDKANSDHQQVFGKLADLDKRIAQAVDQSAQVVAAGRQNLDTVRDWVTAAANSVPPGKQRDTMLMQVANKGLAELTEVVQKTNADSNTIGQGLRGLKPEYDAIRLSQKFGEEHKGADETAEAMGDEKPGEEDEPKKTDMSSGDIEAIDRANREMLQEMLKEYQQLPDSQAKTDRLADIAGIQEALKTGDSHLVYLEKPDDASQMIHAATSVGDPFKADSVSVTVPGVSSSTRESLATMTREAAELRQEGIQIARTEKMSTNIATIAWMGYQPPLNMDQTSVLNDDLAQAGAPKLTSFLHDIDTYSHNPNHTTALFGHSYGSLTSGIALQEGASAYVDNAVLYGSPGFGADTPTELGMTDDNFFVMAASDDPINYIADLAPLHGWGSNPNDIITNDDGTLRFRFEHLEVDAGDTPLAGDGWKIGASGHPEYGRDALQRMSGYNLATILLNRPDLAVRETPLSW